MANGASARHRRVEDGTRVIGRGLAGPRAHLWSLYPLVGAVLHVAFAASAANAADEPLDLAALSQALEAPTIAGELTTTAPIRIGRAEVQPQPGAKTYVLAAGGRPCGVLIEGPATLTYRVEDRFSVPIGKRNLRRASGITVPESDGALVLSAALKGAAIWGWDLEGVPAGSPAGAAAPVSAWLKDVMDRRINPNPTRDMALNAANGDSGYRWAVFHTSDEDLELDVDPRPFSRTEALGRMNKLDSSAGNYQGRLGSEELVSQPIGRSWWDPVTIEFQSVDTDIQLLNDRDEHAVITSRTRLETLRDGLRVLSLSLRSDWPGPGRRRGLHIEKLTVDGQAAPYVRHYGSLLVQLPSPSRKGQSFVLEVVSEGDVLERPSGDNYWQLLGGWYPRPIAGGQEWSGFQISVEARPPFVPFASVLEINDWGFGMAPPGMIFITQEAFFTAARAELEKANDRVRLVSRGVNERVAHEVAHGWFPHVMKIVSSRKAGFPRASPTTRRRSAWSWWTATRATAVSSGSASSRNGRTTPRKPTTGRAFTWPSTLATGRRTGGHGSGCSTARARSSSTSSGRSWRAGRAAKRRGIVSSLRG